VEEGERIEAGDQLTEGSKNPHRILDILGRDAVTQYLLREVQQVYRPQGQNINDKHFEVIIRKMLSKVILTASGDTEMLPGELVELSIFQNRNLAIAEEGGQPARAEPVLLGITKASLNTDSFLSASSFQHTIKVLAGAAIAGKEDSLIGLKENVIIGKLIPAGTGFTARQERLAEKLAAEALIEEEKMEVDLSTLLIDDNTDEEVLERIAAQAAAEAAKAALGEVESTD
jgi:DNA-directed RNA polymerase subunit beta'